MPTRGLIYSVFAELDQEDKGKLTYSEFEDAAVVVGLRQEQARVFYDMWVEAGGSAWPGWRRAEKSNTQALGCTNSAIYSGSQHPWKLGSLGTGSQEE